MLDPTQPGHAAMLVLLTQQCESAAGSPCTAPSMGLSCQGVGDEGTTEGFWLHGLKASCPMMGCKNAELPQGSSPRICCHTLGRQEKPQMGSKPSSRAFPMPGSQPQDPLALPQSPAPSPLPELLLSSHRQWLWDPYAPHPVGSPTVCPWPKQGPSVCSHSPVVSARSHVCSAGKEKNRRHRDVGFLFHFIQVPLKRSLYKSEHEDAQEASPGLHGRWRMLRSANVHIYREPPEKKRGRRKSQAW